MEDLATDRLVIRPFRREELATVHRILNEAFGADDTLVNVGSWLEWSMLSARWFPAMNQFPYGDRAISLRETDEVVGVAGYVPIVMPFDQIPELARHPGPRGDHANEGWGMSAEVGLFWAVDPARQRNGYATEAALALIDYAFEQRRLWRIIATTEYDNHASQAVMRKAHMTLTRNPLPEPPWMQVVGVRYARASIADGSHEPPGLLT